MRALALALLISAPAWGDGAVTVSVESNQVTAGTPFRLMVRAEGRKVGRFEIPRETPGIRIEPGVVFSNSLEIRTGRTEKTRVEKHFLAVAREAGRVVVPPVGVTVDGRMTFSKPLELTVTPAAPQPETRPPEARRTAEGGVGLEDAVFVTSEVDKAEVYEQEPIRLTLAVWQLDHEAIDVEPYRPEIEAPATEGFYAVPRVPAFVSQDREERGGQAYRVIRFQQFLYPARPGELTVGQWTWQGIARFLTSRGFMTRDLSLKAAPVAVRVKPLPKPRPADFHGAVGDFELRADLTDYHVAQGMPTKLVIRIVGEGNAAAIGDPALPAIEGVHAAEPIHQETPIRDPDGIAVEKSFIYALTPTRPGMIHIPEISYTYFDAGAERYVTRRAGPFDLEVTPSRENTQRVVVDASTPPPGEVAPPQEGIAPLVVDPGVLQPRRNAFAATALLAVSPPLAFLALSLLMARRRRFQQDVRYARSYHARSRALRRLERSGAESDAADVLFRAMAGFVADKLGVAEAGLTSADVARLLEANGVNGELREGYLRVLRACERVRYGGSTLSEDEQHALAHAAMATMDGLESELRGGAR